MGLKFSGKEEQDLWSQESPKDRTVEIIGVDEMVEGELETRECQHLWWRKEFKEPQMEWLQLELVIVTRDERISGRGQLANNLVCFREMENLQYLEIGKHYLGFSFSSN